jgi:hypothetical protein
VFDSVVVKALATGKHYLDNRKAWAYYSIPTGIQSNGPFNCDHLSCVIQSYKNKTLYFLIGIPYKNSRTARLTLYNIAGRTLVERSITGYGYHVLEVSRGITGRGAYVLNLTNGSERIYRRIICY